MNIAGKSAWIEPAQQPGDQVEVGAVDQFPIGLKGVSAIGNAIEDGSGLYVAEEGVEVGVDQQVGNEEVFAGQALEPPGGEAGRRSINVLAVLKKHAQKVGADEATGSQHQ